MAISGNADFTINSNTCTGSIPSSCATQIKFAPTSAALETATVTYTDDATGSPQTVAVSGTGVPATPTLSVNPTSLNFGGVQVHTTSSNGPIVLTISSGPVTFTGTPVSQRRQRSRFCARLQHLHGNRLRRFLPNRSKFHSQRPGPRIRHVDLHR